MSNSTVLIDGLYSYPIIIGSSLTLLSAAVVIGEFFFRFRLISGWRQSFSRDVPAPSNAGTYRHYEELRRHPNGLVYWKSVLDTMFASTMIIEAGMRLGGIGSSVHCQIVAFFIEFSLIGSELCFLMLSVDLFTALRDPFVDYKANMRKYFAATFIAAGSLSGALVGPNFNGLTDFGTCWLGYSGYNLWAFFLSYLIAIYAWSFFVLIYARRRLAKGLRDTYEARMLSFRHGVVFVAGYAVFWLVVAAVYGGSLATPTSPNVSPVAWAFCLLFTSRGVATMLCWLANHDLRAVQQSEAAARFKFGGTLGRVNRQLQPHLNLALRKEVLHYTTLAIRMSVMHAAGEASVLRALAGVKQQLQLQRAAAAATAAVPDASRNRRATFLRRMSSVFIGGAGRARGGAAAAPTQHENPLLFSSQQQAPRQGGQRRGSALLPLHEPDDGTVPAALSALLSPYNDTRPDGALFFDWKPLEISLNAHLFERGGLLDFGEFFGAAQQQKQQPSRSSAPAVQADSEPVAPTPTSAYDGVIHRPPLELRDLAPDVFARIRHVFGISPAQFLYSLSRTTKETFSEGASGAFM
jgi:hypothetical protein